MTRSPADQLYVPNHGNVEQNIVPGERYKEALDRRIASLRSGNPVFLTSAHCVM